MRSTSSDGRHRRYSRLMSGWDSFADIIGGVGGALVGLPTGVLLLSGVSWAPYALFPTTCVAIIGGLTSAHLLLTKLGE